MTELALKVKTKSGHKVLRNLTSNSTVQDLKSQLSALGNIPTNRLQVLTGFPPKIFDLAADSKLLSDAGISSGDTLILEEKAVVAEVSFVTPQLGDSPTSITARNSTSFGEEARHHVSESQQGFPGILMKRVVPADNSCLFTSIHFVLNGKVDESGGVAPLMRQMIAETISKDPDNFSEAILGKPNPDYCKWILDDKSWGGAIELAVLSNYYGIEIDVVDTINAIINRFGEDQKYPHRVLLLFDGIHYDPLYLESLQGGDIQTIFPVDDDRILRDAEQLAQEAKSSRQFTDVNKFTLKCMICNIMISGQTQAQQHAQTTGHTNFGEI